MTASRWAVGSVSTMAVGALLLGAAPYLIHHPLASAASSPWGAIASFSGTPSTGAPADGDRSQLLKLAALKSGNAAADPAMAAAAQLSAVPAPAPAPVVTPVAAPAGTTAVPDTMATAAPAPAVEQAQPLVMASADEPADNAPEAAEAPVVPTPPVARARSASGLVNINTASADALDHFPGAGRIGHAIVTHRPYHSIDDLVRKRVLRTSDYQRIQGRISVD